MGLADLEAPLLSAGAFEVISHSAVPRAVSCVDFDAVVVSESAPQTEGRLRLDLLRQAAADSTLYIVECRGRHSLAFSDLDAVVVPPRSTVSDLAVSLGLSFCGDAAVQHVAPAIWLRPSDAPVLGYKAVELWAGADGSWRVSGPFAGWPAPLDAEANCTDPEHETSMRTPDPDAGCFDGFSAYLEPHGARAWGGDTPWPIATVELYGTVLNVGRPRSWTELNAQHQRVVAVEISDCSCGSPAVGFRRGTWDPADRDWEALPSCEACADNEGLLTTPFEVHTTR